MAWREMDKVNTFLVKTGLVAAVAIGLILGIGAWQSEVRKRREERAYREAARLVDRGRCKEALALIRAHRLRFSEALPDTAEGRWLDLEIAAFAREGRGARLLWFYERAPKRFARHERASLLVGRVLLHMGEREELGRLRRRWWGRETDGAGWLMLDADRALQEGRWKDALALLQSRTFPGAEDCGRLIRLALLHAGEPAKARKYLQKAFEADPDNAEAGLLRGSVAAQ